MGESGGLAPLLGDNAFCLCLLHPSFRSQYKAVQTGFPLNCIEFEAIQIILISLNDGEGPNKQDWSINSFYRKTIWNTV